MIFSYLTPSMLLEASRASKAWRESTLDGRLWKQKFSLEGWGLDMNEVRMFEQRYNLLRTNRLQRAKPQTDQRRQRKRPRAEVDGADEGTFSRQPRSVTNDLVQAWSGRHGTEMRDSLFASKLNQDEEMQDFVPDVSGAKHTVGYPELKQRQAKSESGFDMEEKEYFQNDEMHRSTGLASETEAKDDMMIHTASGHSRINYHYVFKQKRKLEENWNTGSYKSFQLPHRDHPEEAHSECVYTIQYIGNYLVSGSRDRTLRIWDLDTQRLVRKPLEGHTASVLCLQFDNRENEDIIISGSSDTDVIIWRFSTGKMLRKIQQAHRESVLNLKFDHRYLVTCSKDKTIKIWSRHELRPGDKDYPVKGVNNGGKCPDYIIDLQNCGGSIDMDNYLTPEQRKPLKPYTPLMLIDSHGAAVNAIHIYQDQLVSASGDRYVKVFDIHTGVRTAVCAGHLKGIACVQYDGKRVVSGSSDNTIRIFDPATQAEVACLTGHSRLVRTIQSAFGDFPDTNREQLETEAAEIDREYFEARRRGNLPTNSLRTQERNAGSRQPKDIMAVGAKLPPGGGGSRWGRIVSGSYDETIIIWKKASDGRWVIAHRLRQEEALRAAGGPLISQSDLQSQPSQPSQLPQNGEDNSQQLPAPQNQPETSGQGAHNPATLPPPIQQAMQAGLHGVAHTGAQQPVFPMAHLQSIQQLLHQHMTNNSTTASIASPAIQQLQQYMASNPAMTASSSSAAANVVSTANSQSILTATSYAPWFQQPQFAGPLSAAQNAASHAAYAAQQQQIPQQATIPNQATPMNPGAASAGVPQPNARVFKLQFDARRIICCSQDPKIVGWDFANSDERIVECSRFFDTPQ